tara:strand:- start:1218 stop:1556 length:339 start_codon:yes stop_codon:yes gene_type:complete
MNTYPADIVNFLIECIDAAIQVPDGTFADVDTATIERIADTLPSRCGRVGYSAQENAEHALTEAEAEESEAISPQWYQHLADTIAQLRASNPGEQVEIDAIAKLLAPMNPHV